MKYLTKPPRIKKYDRDPAIILLHGYGSNEEDLFSLADHLPSEYFVISLQAPIALGGGGFCWFDIRWGSVGFSTDHKEVQAAIDYVNVLLNSEEKKLNIDLKRSILFGFSQGAILSYALSVQKPELFKTIIGCSGAWLPSCESVQKTTSKTYAQHNILICHGTEDPVLPHSESTKVAAYFKELNISHQFNSYPIGHAISPQEIKDIKEWVNNL